MPPLRFFCVPADKNQAETTSVIVEKKSKRGPAYFFRICVTQLGFLESSRENYYPFSYKQVSIALLPPLETDLNVKSITDSEVLRKKREEKGLKFQLYLYYFLLISLGTICLIATQVSKRGMKKTKQEAEKGKESQFKGEIRFFYLDLVLDFRLEG